MISVSTFFPEQEGILSSAAAFWFSHGIHPEGHHIHLYLYEDVSPSIPSGEGMMITVLFVVLAMASGDKMNHMSDTHTNINSS